MGDILKVQGWLLAGAVVAALLSGCAQIELGTQKTGEYAGVGLSRYCMALPEVRQQIRGNFNTGLGMTCPGCTVKVTCPADPQ